LRFNAVIVSVFMIAHCAILLSIMSQLLLRIETNRSAAIEDRLINLSFAISSAVFNERR